MLRSLSDRCEQLLVPTARRTPDWAQAARWSTSRPRTRRHRQVREVKGRGSRRRRRKITLKRCWGVARVRPMWNCGEGTASIGARLRGQHSSPWWINCVVDFIVESCMASLGCSALPTFLKGWAFKVAGGVGRGRFSLNKCAVVLAVLNLVKCQPKRPNRPGWRGRTRKRVQARPCGVGGGRWRGMWLGWGLCLEVG